MTAGLDWSRLSRRQMLQLDACTRCGECQTLCPVFEHDSREGVVPRGKARGVKRLLQEESRLLRLFGRRVSEQETEALISDLYECSVCGPVSYTHLRAHETVLDLVCRLLLEKKKKQQI